MNRKNLDEELLKKFAGDGVIEFCLFTPRSKIGAPCWEIKIRKPDGSRKVVKVSNYGFAISDMEIKLNAVKTRMERDTEIYRLYNEEHLSQTFLANLFNISQPSVSLIVKKK